MSCVLLGTPDQYIDLSNSIVELTVQVLRDDGTLLDYQEKCGPINNLAHSMFKQVSPIYIQLQKEIELDR